MPFPDWAIGRASHAIVHGQACAVRRGCRTARLHSITACSAVHSCLRHLVRVCSVIVFAPSSVWSSVPEPPRVQEGGRAVEARVQATLFVCLKFAPQEPPSIGVSCSSRTRTRHLLGRKLQPVISTFIQHCARTSPSPSFPRPHKATNRPPAASHPAHASTFTGSARNTTRKEHSYLSSSSPPSHPTHPLHHPPWSRHYSSPSLHSHQAYPSYSAAAPWHPHHSHPRPRRSSARSAAAAHPPRPLSRRSSQWAPAAIASASRTSLAYH